MNINVLNGLAAVTIMFIIILIVEYVIVYMIDYEEKRRNNEQ